MATLNLNDKDINELLTVLHTALIDSQSVMRVISEQEFINSRRAYEDTIRKWIYHFSQQPGFEHHGMKESGE